MKLLRRLAILILILIAAIYGLALGYLRSTESSQAFLGADLSGDERLSIARPVPAPWDTVRVRTDDGVKILLFENRLSENRESPWVIYFYGREGRLADYVGSAQFILFREVGLNVLSVDYRGYGASQKAQPTEAGVYADARAAWRFLTETRGVSPDRVVLYGYSLGGAVAIQLASEVSPVGLITEGAFASGPEWVHFYYRWVPTWLARSVMRNRFENREKARTLSLPWLLFHGRLDEITPFIHAEFLAGTTAGPRRLVPLECGHEDAIELERDRMQAALEEFLGGLFGATNGA